MNELVEKARAVVREELARAFGKVDLGSLPEVAEGLESILTWHFEHMLREHPSLLAPDCYQSEDTGHFVLDRTHFDLRISPNLLEAHVLEVALYPMEQPLDPRDFKATSATLRERGLYREIRLYAPVKSRFSTENLAVLAEAIFETGYRWLDETTKGITRSEIVNVGKDLYRMLRELLPDKSLASNLWLAAFSGEKGSYLLDPDPAMHAVTAVSHATVGVDASPISLVGRFLTTVLSYPETHSSGALEADQCISVSLDDSKYSDSKTVFLQAEKAIFGSPDISIFPIYKSDSGKLVAVFPTAHLDPLEPFLRNHRDLLVERFLESSSRFKKFLAVLSSPRRTLAYGEIGEFVGGVVKGVFIDS